MNKTLWEQRGCLSDKDDCGGFQRGVNVDLDFEGWGAFLLKEEWKSIPAKGNREK